jgi:hypothetical protein
LFSFSGEDKVYTPGKDRIIVEYKESDFCFRFVMIFVFLFLQEIMMIMMPFYMLPIGLKKSREHGNIF